MGKSSTTSNKKGVVSFKTSNSSGSSGISVGDTINGSNNNTFVTTNGVGNLITSSNLSYNNSTKILSFNDNLGNIIFYLDFNNKTVQIGDADGSANSTYMTISDTTRMLSLNSGQIDLLGVVRFRVTTPIYGSTQTFNELSATNHYAFQGSDTGASTINVTNADFMEGTTFTVSDIDRKSGTNPITIDFGLGNTLTTQVGSTQTFDIDTDGMSATFCKVAANKWILTDINNPS